MGLVYSQHPGHLSAETSQTAEVGIARIQLFIYLFDYEFIFASSITQLGLGIPGQQGASALAGPVCLSGIDSCLPAWEASK